LEKDGNCVKIIMKITKVGIMSAIVDEKSATQELYKLAEKYSYMTDVDALTKLVDENVKSPSNPVARMKSEMSALLDEIKEIDGISLDKVLSDVVERLEKNLYVKNGIIKYITSMASDINKSKYKTAQRLLAEKQMKNPEISEVLKPTIAKHIVEME
jgi:hypothetical protein